MNLRLALLLFVTVVWGTTFPLLKVACTSLSGVEISTARFLLAALCMLPFVHKAPRRAWIDGTLLGAIALVSYVAQAYGLEHISSNRSAFLTSLNVLMVPLLGVMFGGRLSLHVLLAAGLACAGIGLMSWEGGSSWLGDGMTLLSAFAYALYVLFLSQRAHRHEAKYLAATQITLMAMFGSLWVGLFSPDAALSTLSGRLLQHAPTLVYLGVVATAGMLLLQAVAQRHVPAHKAAVIYALEPVFAALFGWLILDESLSTRAGIGAGIVVIAVILSELNAPSPQVATSDATA